jgi:two-component system phosphate regulon sensor histidine kinase PhoR
MKRNITLIILVTYVSLIGIVITQIYWVKKAYDLKEEQFNNSVLIALKSVANQLQMRYAQELEPEDNSILSNIPRIEQVKKEHIAASIEEEFNCMKITDNYYYAVIDRKADTVVTGEYGKYMKEIIDSKHQLRLTGFRDSDRYAISAYFSNQSSIILIDMVLWLILTSVFILVVILTFYFTINFFLKQKNLSEMKTDFFNNMTHELKTPISTISLASEMLMGKNVYEDPNKTKRYATVIFDENARLQHHVEHILNMTLLDKGDLKLKIREIDIHKILVKAVNNYNLIVKKRNGVIFTVLYAKKFNVYGDREHLRNVFTNLLDNANKYSPESPEVTVTTKNENNGIVISIEDNGIGISQENQKLIFKRLYRVPTGNIYQAKGFGLGLFYVKTVVEAHKGSVKVSSELGKGSRFDIYLPFDIKPAHDDEQNES